MSQNDQTHFKKLVEKAARFSRMSDHFTVYFVYACLEGLRMSTSLLKMIASELPLELHLHFSEVL